jgi:hypothetical protein
MSPAVFGVKPFPAIADTVPGFPVLGSIVMLPAAWTASGSISQIFASTAARQNSLKKRFFNVRPLATKILFIQGCSLKTSFSTAIAL